MLFADLGQKLCRIVLNGSVGEGWVSDGSKHPIPFPAWGALCSPGAAEDGQGLAGLILL